ncbi:PREDICTED: uncharacterized protein LOC104763031 [Camelina sativa]|uniref:Uncharacterized protein LOC104763031 n=1 Tax=Camelina sativa TaxID=90675 RepID=A0ABM1R900_CAMSA|nr:PREDICTED: uncharacterized protein LOC104763031 [Camelina sativa]
MATQWNSTERPGSGNEFTDAVREFFSSSFLPSCVNATSLVLITKRRGADDLKDFRPISCLNTNYKVVSRIISDRLKQILPSIILPNQTDFINDRLLIENVLLASEVLQGYHLSTLSPRLTLKVDISKAFDSVRWDFVTSTLLSYGAPDLFVGWIKSCICSPSFSISINGVTSGYFKGKTGLRQGDPLSPILFVSVMNILSLMLNRAAQDGIFGYHPGCEELELTHLCFADDLLIFLDGTEASLAGVFTVLSQFEKISGLSVNITKTTMFSSGVSEDALTHQGKDELLAPSSVEHCGQTAAIKHSYFGVNWFLDKCFPSSQEDKPSGAKVAWADLLYPKREGGLGLRSWSTWNDTCALKFIWMIYFRAGSIWVAWVRRKYFSSSCFSALNDKSPTVSWMFRKLLKLRHIAIKFRNIKLGTGEDTFFWWDPWTPYGSLFHYLGNDAPHHLGIPVTALVSDYKEGAIWNLPQARSDCFLDVLSFITTIPHSNDNDSPSWIVNSKVQKSYNSKVMWNSLRLSRPLVPWYSIVWHKAAVPKHSIATWLFLRNRNPTLDRMIKWGFDVEPLCLLCGMENETRNHLFFACAYSSAIWTEMVGKLELSPPLNWELIVHWLPSATSSSVTSLALLQVWQACIYEIWKERNRHFHEGTTLPHSIIVRKTCLVVKSRATALRNLATNGSWSSGLRTGEALELFWSSH